MRFGGLNEIVSGFQQGTGWEQQQQDQSAARKAQVIRGLALLAQMKGGQPPAPDSPPPDQAAPGVQGPQGAAAPDAIASLAGMTPGQQPPQVPTGPVPAGASFAQAFSPQGQGAPAPGAPPGPAQQQQMKPPPVPGLSSTAQPDAAGMDDPIKAANQSYATIAKSIYAAHPNIDPRTLIMAVDQQIDSIKGLAPLTKAALQAQSQMTKFMYEDQYKQAKLTEAAREYEGKLQELNNWHGSKAAHDEALLAAQNRWHSAQDTLGYARIDAGERNTDARDKAMQDRANTAAAAALDREIARAKGTERNALIAAKAKVASALLGSFKSDAQVGGVGDEADSIMGDGSPAGGGQAPAPAGGQNFAAQGGKKAPDGHWYKPNTGPDKKTHPYLRLD